MCTGPREGRLDPDEVVFPPEDAFEVDAALRRQARGEPITAREARAIARAVEDGFEWTPDGGFVQPARRGARVTRMEIDGVPHDVEGVTSWRVATADGEPAPFVLDDGTQVDGTATTLTFALDPGAADAIAVYVADTIARDARAVTGPLPAGLWEAAVEEGPRVRPGDIVHVLTHDGDEQALRVRSVEGDPHGEQSVTYEPADGPAAGHLSSAASRSAYAAAGALRDAGDARDDDLDWPFEWGRPTPGVSALDPMDPNAAHAPVHAPGTMLVDEWPALRVQDWRALVDALRVAYFEWLDLPLPGPGAALRGPLASFAVSTPDDPVCGGRFRGLVEAYRRPVGPLPLRYFEGGRIDDLAPWTRSEVERGLLGGEFVEQAHAQATAVEDPEPVRLPLDGPERDDANALAAGTTIDLSRRRPSRLGMWAAYRAAPVLVNPSRLVTVTDPS
jgi:biotin carboxyl carrier protein